MLASISQKTNEIDLKKMAKLNIEPYMIVIMTVILKTIKFFKIKILLDFDPHFKSADYF